MATGTVLVSALLLTGCDHEKNGSANPVPATATPAPSTNHKVFQVKGVIKELKPDGKTVSIRHEEIPDYMPAMVMPFEARNPKDLSGLRPRDTVAFRMTVTGDDVWIDQIKKLNLASTGGGETSTSSAPIVVTAGANGSGVKVVRDVDILQIGDVLPEYSFTNELGQAVTTSQFKGQAVALTFIFTRCPLPTFCPLMTHRFAEVQKQMLAANSPTNWHLLTMTFDPEFDTPAILKSHAERNGADPARWSFLTGSLEEITTMGQQFGEVFWREQGALNHNLRTVVLDPRSRVQAVFQGNQWTSEELVKELTQAAQK